MKTRRPSSTPVLTSTVAGALVGLVFPVSAAVAELALGETRFNFGALFLGSPTDLVVLLSPIVVAAAGFILGRGRRQVNKRIAELNADRERMDAELQAHYELIGAVEKSQRAILDHLDSGICTVDPSLRIDQSYNSSFSSMFGSGEPAGKPITDVVFGAWTEKQKADLREVVGLAFSNTASSDEMLNDILPAREVVHVGALGSGGDVKYVHVSVTRLFRNQGVERVMFIFRDVTLERRFKEEEERHQRQIDDQYKRIRQLLRHERTVTYGFLASLGAGMDRLAVSLRSLSQGEVNRPAVMEATGIVHSIKGEAFSLDFDSCAEKAKTLETSLKKVADKTLGMEEHLEIIQHFEALSDERRVFERMLGRMADIAAPKGSLPDAPAGQDLLRGLEAVIERYRSEGIDVSALQALTLRGREPEGTSLAALEEPLSLACKRSAKELGKRAQLSFSGLDDRVPGNVFASLKESLLHLVRNSIAHGIESPEDRRARGKPEQGTISLSMRRADGKLSIDYADDGRGFDTESIRAVALARGLVTPDAARSLTTPDLIKYVFVDGFSTNAGTDMVAGQGVGMSVVKRAIMGDLHGSIRLSQKPGRGIGCRLSIPDPLPAPEVRA